MRRTGVYRKIGKDRHGALIYLTDHHPQIMEIIGSVLKPDIV